MMYEENQPDPKFSRNIAPMYRITNLGNRAHQYLGQTGKARILGVVTKGVFLQTQNGEIIFLTDAPYRGPLTVNLQNRIDFNECFSIGEVMMIRSNRLVFKTGQIFLSSQTTTWAPFKVKFSDKGLHQAVTRGIALANNLKGKYTDGLFFPFLDQLTVDSLEFTRNSFWTFFPELDLEDDPIKRLSRFIGLGSGLTPAGDDFLCGFFLARYFIEQGCTQSQKYLDIGERIHAEAHKKTTALSAAMIRCALDGEADERLLDGLSYIAQGRCTIQEVSRGILSYGSSSGIDALAGMLAATLIQYLIEEQPK